MGFGVSKLPSPHAVPSQNPKPNKAATTIIMEPLPRLLDCSYFSDNLAKEKALFATECYMTG